MVAKLHRIPFIVNDFSAYQHHRYDWAWMPRSQVPFAARKPAFRCQKNKNQDQPAEGIPLPGVSFVRPKEDFLDYAQQSVKLR